MALHHHHHHHHGTPRGTLRMLPCVAAVLGCAAAAEFKLEPWANNGIRIRIAPSGGSIVDQPYMALDRVPVTHSTPVMATKDGTELVNGNLKVSIDEGTKLVTATRVSDGKVLLRQTAILFADAAVPVTNKKNRRVSVSFAGHASERIYGLGEHRTGTVNQMPYNKTFVQSQLYSYSHGGDVSIPWYCSDGGYGFVWNSPAYGNVSITEKSIDWLSEANANADFWITTTTANSPNPWADLMSSYVDAVGHAPVMPSYSTGFIQCKDRYRNQTQLLDVARGYVERGLPISVIVIDWKHWVHQGDWSFDQECWPDPQAMVDELSSMGITLMVTFWPFQSRESQHWQDFVSAGYIVNKINGTQASWDGGDQYLYDPFNSAARNATAAGFWNGYGRFGIKTIWLDAAEPERFDESQVGNWKFQAGTDAEVGEAWVQQHVKTIADGHASHGIMPEDYFVLPRHAWAGSWKHSAALWSGDIVSAFSELAIQVKVSQGVAMSGVPLWTTDIGGYHGGNPSDPVFQDLIVRWFQFGAFCPLFRLHGHRDGGPPSDKCGGTNGDNEVWNLAQEPMHYKGITAVMNLREDLRDYVARINAEAAKTGMPMTRPMFLQFPNDPGCQTADVEDQYMFGPDWLVAPVTEYQATNRSVYLPPLPDGKLWVYFFDMAKTYSKSGRIIMETPIDEFPLFVARPRSAV